MILYFSGTGNSAYAAKLTAELTGDEALDLFDKIRNGDHAEMFSDKPWVVAAPVYCWQLPHVVRDWMLETDFSGNKDIYFILTCGSSMGNAEKYLKALCREKGLNYRGCAEIVMPENYIAMFEAPDREKADALWDDLRWRKPGLYRRMRWHSANICLLPGRVGREIDLFIYKQLRKHLKFN